MKQDLKLNVVKEFLKKRGENLWSTNRENRAYSNLVYKITSNKKCYLFKQYVNMQRKNEFEVLKCINVPKVYELKNDYRFEEFIDHQVPDFKGDISLIADALVQFHSMKAPKITTFQDMLVALIKENQQIQQNTAIDNIYEKIKFLFDDHSMDGVLHMDLQVGNMLKVGNTIRLIDFEYSCHGNIAIDIANFFCETMTDYLEDSVLVRSRGFDECHKKKFLEEYVKYSKNKKLTVNNLYEKVEEMVCLSHFLWFLWGRKHVFKNDIVSDSFDYVKYSLNRLYFLEECEFREEVLSLKDELETVSKK